MPDFEYLKFFMIYGIVVMGIIDTALIYIGSKKKVESNVCEIKGYLELHQKYGIWKISSIRIVLLVSISYIIYMSLNPLINIQGLYLIHIVIFAYRLFFKNRVKR